MYAQSMLTAWCGVRLWLLTQIAREKLGDNDANTKKVLNQLVQMKAKKKAMEDALGRLQME